MRLTNKVRSIKQIGFFIILLLSNVVLFAQDPDPIVVSGAGDYWVNNTYYYAGDLNGRPSYLTTEGVNGPIIMFGSGSPGEWEIREDANANLDHLEYATSSDAPTLPPENDWSTEEYGVAPAPTLSGGVFGALPVELTSFSAIVTEDAVQLEWETATEVNNYGFEIEREGTSTSLSASWESLGFVQGHGTTNSPKNYEFTDSELPNASKVSYRLKQIDNDGAFEYSKTITVDLTNITSVESEDIPIEYSLSQNYPNPFNPSTTIKVALPESGSYSLNVYNVLGQQVASLFSGELEAGYHNFSFDASKLSTGIYIYTFRGNNVNIAKKMSLLK